MPVRSKRFRSVLFQSAFPRVPFFSGCAAIVLVMFSYGVMPASGQSNNAANGKPPSSAPREKAGSAPDVARGKYMVEGVAVCGQCHTPTDGSGNPDRSRWLQGGSVPYHAREGGLRLADQRTADRRHAAGLRRRHGQTADHRHLDDRQSICGFPCPSSAWTAATPKPSLLI